MAKFIILISVVLLSVYLTEQAHFLSKEYVDTINEVAITWKVRFTYSYFNTKLIKLHINLLLVYLYITMCTYVNV